VIFFEIISEAADNGCLSFVQKDKQIFIQFVYYIQYLHNSQQIHDLSNYFLCFLRQNH